MAGITLEQAQTELDNAMELHAKLKNGQEARQGDRVLKYSDLSEIRKDIEFWDAKVKTLSRGDGSGNITPKSIVPLG